MVLPCGASASLNTIGRDRKGVKHFRQGELEGTEGRYYIFVQIKRLRRKGGLALPPLDGAGKRQLG
jgi:hypothetical protein